MDLGLKGRTALITGGSRGIGRAIAERLAMEGCNLAICSRNKAQIDEAVAALGRHGVKVTGGAVDVADGPALADWIARSGEQHGGLDIAVANVSAMGGTADEASWRRGFEIDILGTVRTVDAALPFLEKSEAGAIVAIATTAALEYFLGLRAYSSVKAAVINYMSNLATNLAPKGVRANTVSPGTIFFEDGAWGRRKREQPEIYETALKMNPMGRMGRPEEVANAVAFIASPAASFITGTHLVVDGGITRRVQY